MKIEEQIEDLVKCIKNFRDVLETTQNRLRTPETLLAFDKRNASCWCISATGDAIVRLRLITEQNFHFIETLSTLAVARYVFEMSLWLRLFELDERYGLVYYSQLLDTQLRYFQDYQSQLGREIEFLKGFEQMEEAQTQNDLEKFKTNKKPYNKKGTGFSTKRTRDSVDELAARKFSIYADQAKVNGYGFQAYLVKSKIVPQIDQAILNIQAEKQNLDQDVPERIRDLMPKRWNWRQMAEKVKLEDEYDFIYTFSSKLLHATPSSITTDHKMLEMHEFIIFLKYIKVKMSDINSSALRINELHHNL